MVGRRGKYGGACNTPVKSGQCARYRQTLRSRLARQSSLQTDRGFAAAPWLHLCNRPTNTNELDVSPSRDMPRRSISLSKARVLKFTLLAKMLEYTTQMERMGYLPLLKSLPATPEQDLRALVFSNALDTDMCSLDPP